MCWRTYFVTACQGRGYRFSWFLGWVNILPGFNLRNYGTYERLCGPGPCLTSSWSLSTLSNLSVFYSVSNLEVNRHENCDLIGELTHVNMTAFSVLGCLRGCGLSQVVSGWEPQAVCPAMADPIRWTWDRPRQIPSQEQYCPLQGGLTLPGNPRMAAWGERRRRMIKKSYSFKGRWDFYSSAF